jgi:SAM-dependent methyltransferase
MINDDRIFELYNGELFDVESQLVARERIHWICTNVTGKKVLDVGCSQGVVSVILARESFAVVGLDIRDDVIEYANTKKKELHESQQEHLQFVAGTLVEIQDKDFDTIVLGEVLEHQAQPLQLLDSCLERLKDDGQLVITVPFGLNPCNDHKNTFYFTNFFEMLDQRVDVLKTQLIGKYLCCVASKARSQSTSPHDWKALLLETEKSYSDSELNYHKRAEKLKYDNERLRGNLKKFKEMQRDLKRELRKINREKEKLRDFVGRKEKQLDMYKDSTSYKIGKALTSTVVSPAKLLGLKPLKLKD